MTKLEKKLTYARIDAITRAGKKTAAKKAAKAAKAPKAAKPAKLSKRAQAIENAVAKAAKPAKKLGKRAQVQADALAGKLPIPPDFSADTHAPYRKRLDALVTLAEGGDLKGLKAVEMLAPRSTSPKALDRYRNLAIMALEAARK